MDGAGLASSLEGLSHKPGPGWRHQRVLAVVNPGPQGWSTGPERPGSGCDQSHLAEMFFSRCLHAAGSLFTSPSFHKGLRPGHCAPEPALQGRGSVNTFSVQGRPSYSCQAHILLPFGSSQNLSQSSVPSVRAAGSSVHAQSTGETGPGGLFSQHQVCPCRPTGRQMTDRRQRGRCGLSRAAALSTPQSGSLGPVGPPQQPWKNGAPHSPLPSRSLSGSQSSQALGAAAGGCSMQSASAFLHSSSLE